MIGSERTLKLEMNALFGSSLVNHVCKGYLTLTLCSLIGDPFLVTRISIRNLSSQWAFRYQIDDAYTNKKRIIYVYPASRNGALDIRDRIIRPGHEGLLQTAKDFKPSCSCCEVYIIIIFPQFMVRPSHTICE